MSFIDSLVRYWGLDDVLPDAKVTDDAIANFQRRFDVRLPPAVRNFYERFNGLLGDMDSDLNAFWPIEELDTVSAKVEPYYPGIVGQIPNSNQIFAFADHSIWVHVYAMQLSDDLEAATPVSWIADGEFATLTESFTEFWELYLASPHRILVP